MTDERATRPEVKVVDNHEASRFEARVPGGMAIAAYRRDGSRIHFTHTEVPEALEGQGVGSELARQSLAMARAEGLQIVPQCAFIKAYVERHPEAVR